MTSSATGNENSTHDHQYHSSAEELVRRVGQRIGIKVDDGQTSSSSLSGIMDLVCENMRNEYVTEDWQLASLDSFQWKTLGAPIGLAAAVKTLAKFTDAALALDPLVATAGSNSIRASGASVVVTNNAINSKNNSIGGSDRRNDLPSFISPGPVLSKGGDGRASSRISATRTSNAIRTSAIGLPSSRVSTASASPMPGDGERRSAVSPSSRVSAVSTSTGVPFLSGGPRSIGASDEKAPRISTVSFAASVGGGGLGRRESRRSVYESNPAPLPKRRASAGIHAISLPRPPAEDVAIVDETTPSQDSSPHDKRDLEQQPPAEPRQAFDNIPMMSQIDHAPECNRCIGNALKEYDTAARANGKSKPFTQRLAQKIRSFPTTAQFQRALIHSKSGDDLKAHSVFVMELNVLASALFLGAGVELWGLFPSADKAVIVTMEGGELGNPIVMEHSGVPTNLALVYHFLNCALLVTQLVCTTGWIWSLYATAAVAPCKFHEFRVQTRYALDHLLMFTEIGQFLFALCISLVLGAKVATTSPDPIVKKIGFLLPILLLALTLWFTQRLSSYVGRVAFHGMLLMEADPEPIIPNLGGCSSSSSKDNSLHATLAEKELTKRFQQHNVVCEDAVLDACHLAMTQNYDYDEDDQQYAGGAFSLLDIIFPDGREPAGTSTTTLTDATDTRMKDHNAKDISSSSKRQGTNHHQDQEMTGSIGLMIAST